MRYKDIYTLIDGGFLAATGHCLPDEQFYKWCKFRGMLNRAMQEMNTQRILIGQECGVPPVPEPKVSKKVEERFLTAFGNFLDEESPVKLADKIPMEFYKAVYDENRKDGQDIFSNIEIETLVLENLFTE